MTALTDDEIVDKITAYTNTITCRDWYVGITKDLDQRLFLDHNVLRGSSDYIHCQAIDIDHARSAERKILARGYDGGEGGGDNSAVYVYAYKKTDQTIER